MILTDKMQEKYLNCIDNIVKLYKHDDIKAADKKFNSLFDRWYGLYLKYDNMERYEKKKFDEISNSIFLDITIPYKNGKSRLF